MVARLAQCLAVASVLFSITDLARSESKAACTSSDDVVSLLQQGAHSKRHRARSLELTPETGASLAWLLPETEADDTTTQKVVPDDSKRTLSAEELASDKSKKSNHTATSSYFWSGKNGDLGRTGASPYAVSRDFTGGPTWNFDLKLGEVQATPLIDDLRNIYLMATNGEMHKVDVDGNSVWNYSVGKSVLANPTIADGSVFVATESGEVVSIDMTSGQHIFRKQVAPCKTASAWSLAAGSGVVVLALRGGAHCGNRSYIQAVDAEKGELLWTYEPAHMTLGRGLSAGLFAIEGSSMVFANIEGDTYKLDLHTGAQVWAHGSSLTKDANFIDADASTESSEKRDSKKSKTSKHHDEAAGKTDANKKHKVSDDKGDKGKHSDDEKNMNETDHEDAETEKDKEEPHALSLSEEAAVANQRATRASGEASATSGLAVAGPGEVIFVTSNPLRTETGKRAGRIEALNFTSGEMLWQANLNTMINNGPVVGQLHPSGKGTLSVLVTVESTRDFSKADKADEKEPEGGKKEDKSQKHQEKSDGGKTKDKSQKQKEEKGSKLEEQKAQKEQAVGSESSEQHQLVERQHRGRVLAFAALSGKLSHWAYQQPAWEERKTCSGQRVQAFSNPAIGGDGTVYVGSGSGKLYAIRDHNGDGFVSTDEVNTFSVGSTIGASPGIAPGLLVAAPCHGLLVFKSF